MWATNNYNNGSVGNKNKSIIFINIVLLSRLHKLKYSIKIKSNKKTSGIHQNNINFAIIDYNKNYRNKANIFSNFYNIDFDSNF